MWFRRLFRRRRKPPSIDLSALDRLEELIARVIALVPEPVHAPPAEPAPSAPSELRAAPVPAATAHLLFVPGYELVEQDGPAPPRGEGVEHAGRSHCVLRHGPSPFPGDPRRCAFLASAWTPLR